MKNTGSKEHLFRLSIVLLLLFPIGNFNHLKAYGENVSGFEKEEMVKEIQQLVSKIKKTSYTKADLGYFPMLKVRTDVYNDSILLEKLHRIYTADLSKVKSYDELEDITRFLIEVNDAIHDIKEFERLINVEPPVVSLDEILKHWDFKVQRQSGKEVAVDIDTNKINLFSLLSG